MSKTTSAELSLINDSEFLEELGQFAAAPQRDDYDGLESGLPMHPGAPAIAEPDEQAFAAAHADPATNPYDQPSEALPAVPARQIPMLTAALVLAACLSAGAATAAFLFQAQLPRLTALLPAIR